MKKLIAVTIITIAVSFATGCQPQQTPRGRYEMALAAERMHSLAEDCNDITKAQCCEALEHGGDVLDTVLEGGEQDK